VARAKRHYIAGQVWHLTHRCHKREFLLRFAKDRRRWLQWLFEAKRRYELRNIVVDLVIFLWDPMQPQPHDVDVKALLRISVLYNIPTACNRSTADFMISSPLLNAEYEPVLKDYSGYIGRTVRYE
jgi:REP element-mobilizing transposase RayT